MPEANGLPTQFNLADWDKRTPINADKSNPNRIWGKFFVFEDHNVTRENPIPGDLLAKIHDRFRLLLNELPYLQSDPAVLRLADPAYDFADAASMDGKVLLVQPKQPGYQILSMQYHGRQGLGSHFEIWRADTSFCAVMGRRCYKPYGWADDEIQAELDNLTVMHFEPGQYHIILPGQFHALAKPSDSPYAVVHEWRFSPEPGRSALDREENIVRLYDNAGRGSLGPFPAEIMAQL